jgi:YD repeat-containing protein
VGALKIDAVTGRPDITIQVPGLGVLVDDQGRMARFYLPGGPLFDVARRGHPIASVFDSSTHFAFTYTRSGRLKQVSGTGGAATFTYNSAGLVQKLDFGGGTTQSFGYDSDGRARAFSDSGGDSGTFSYSAGHLKSAVITLTAMDPTFDFNYSAGRIASWSDTDTTTVTSDFTLNSAGDVTLVKQGTTTDAALTYLRAHVLSKVTDSGGGTIAAFAYGGKGRLSTATNSASQTTSFHYNPLGRLSSATYPTGISSTATSNLTYDAQGRLVKITPTTGEQIHLSYVPAPAVKTNPATQLGPASATLNGAVNPHGLTASYRFQFGKTRRYGHFTPVRSAGAGKLPVDVAASLGHLDPGTTYHFRLIATTPAGTSAGADLTFETKQRR